MPNRRVLTLKVLPAWEGRTVKNLLLRQLHMSEGLIARVKLRETGLCRNGERCRTVDRVRAGGKGSLQMIPFTLRDRALPDAPVSVTAVTGRLSDLLKGDEHRYIAAHPWEFQEQGAEWTLTGAAVKSLDVRKIESFFFQDPRNFAVDLLSDAYIRLEEIGRAGGRAAAVPFLRNTTKAFWARSKSRRMRWRSPSCRVSSR